MIVIITAIYSEYTPVGLICTQFKIL